MLNGLQRADMDTAPILSIYRSMTAPISIASVVAALRSLGGAAHQDAIVDLLAGSPWAKDEVAREVDQLLRSHPERPNLLERAFGPESRRWRLTNLAWDYPLHALA
jgi:hypothetical protein